MGGARYLHSSLKFQITTEKKNVTIRTVLRTPNAVDNSQKVPVGGGLRSILSIACRGELEKIFYAMSSLATGFVFSR